MIYKEFDSIIIGGGSAGMSAALEIYNNGFTTAIIEREEYLGGVLIQCIHNGFGLHEFKEELTGPEYAQRFENIILNTSISIFLETTVTDISIDNKKEIFCYSKKHGFFVIIAKVIVLAMGCRERNRGNIGIPGTRPAGIYTAGLAQRFINIDGYIPGKDVVILGSGDIGLIMARRMIWSGCKVHAVIEIQKYPSGLTRNIVQCLNDNNVPLYLEHTISKIHGKDRVEKVEIVPINEGRYNYTKTFEINCDTILLSVGLIPENELSRKIGIEINPQNNGPFVDSSMMTSIPGIFACGNVLHVHDIVDFVTEESRKTGFFVSEYLKGKISKKQIDIKIGKNIRYIVPQKINLEIDNKIYFRSMIVKNDAILEIKFKDNIQLINKKHVQPSEMISLIINKDELKKYDSNSFIEISLY
jgi:thioredoxin reductase